MKFLRKTRGCLIVIWIVFCVSVLFFLSMDSMLFSALEQNRSKSETKIEINPHEYSGYGCNNADDLNDNRGGITINCELESASGFGCGSSCGASREEGYSSTYPNACKNWQVMPIISPLFKYWIDESTLSSLTETQKNEFINNVDKAAAEWNSVRISDCTEAIVNLQKQSSNGINVVPVKYEPSLSGALGEFNPVPGFHEIKIKNYNNYTTILHEFGHMIGLQDLDMNNSIYTHISLMGYKKDGLLHYQDIQGLAVANGKHSSHDFRRYWYDGSRYNYVCYYCDITDSVSSPKDEGAHLENASTCKHRYSKLVSAEKRQWLKCIKCYKVIESDYFVQVKDDLTIELFGIINDVKVDLVIPKRIGGQLVTSIGSQIFSCQTKLRTVVLPNSITDIGEDAFKDCSNLTSINIPSSVTTIGRGAFSGCTSLTNIQIPSSVTEIEYATFKNCTHLISINIPSSVTTIGRGAFSGCTSLTNIQIPTSVTEIGLSAFEGCTSLQNITLPFIGEKADGTGETHFGYVFGAMIKAGQNEYLPQNLTVRIDGASTIPAGAFYGIDRIEKLILSSTVTEIENGAFSYHTNLSQLEVEAGNPVFWASGKCLMQGTTVVYGWKGCVIPQTATKIGDFAFQNRADLTGVVLPESVAEIGEEAFRNSGLLQIDLPSGLTAMGEKAFCGCSSLSAVTVSAGCSLEVIPYQAFKDCSSLTDVTIPETVEEIGSFAFYHCSNLSEVVIPATVTEIGLSAFEGCGELENVVFEEESELETIGDWAFASCDSLTMLRLPENVGVIAPNTLKWSSQMLLIYVEKSGGEVVGLSTLDLPSLQMIIVPKKSDLAFYQTEETTERVAKKFYYAATDLALITDDTYWYSMDYFLPYEFKTVYVCEDAASLAGYSQQCLDVGEYAGVIFFVRSQGTFAAAQMMQEYFEEYAVPAFVIGNVDTGSVQLPTIVWDKYSMGYNIAQAYKYENCELNGDSWEDWVAQLEWVYQERGYIPAATSDEELRRDACFWMGLADGLGMSVRLFNVEEMLLEIDSFDYGFFDNWLLIEIDSSDWQEFEASSWHFSRFFSIARDSKDVYNSVYWIQSKMDYVDLIVDCVNNEEDIRETLAEWEYSPVELWGELGYSVEGHTFEEFIGLWQEWYPELNVTAWQEYRNRYYNVGEADLTVTEDGYLCRMEQVVERI